MEDLNSHLPSQHELAEAVNPTAEAAHRGTRGLSNVFCCNHFNVEGTV